MRLLAALLALNAVLHGAVVPRPGLATTAPFAVSGVVCAALAAAVTLTAPYAVWTVLALAVIGITGLTLTFMPLTATRR